MSALTFRHAMLADKPVIVDFMNANWGTASPLIAYDDFFDHYYRTPDTLQFAFAEEDGVPVALAGYIRANTSDAPDIWVSIWCAVKGNMVSSLPVKKLASSPLEPSGDLNSVPKSAFCT